jgi:hypothetical protein
VHKYSATRASRFGLAVVKVLVQTGSMFVTATTITCAPEASIVVKSFDQTAFQAIVGDSPTVMDAGRRTALNVTILLVKTVEER